MQTNSQDHEPVEISGIRFLDRFKVTPHLLEEIIDFLPDALYIINNDGVVVAWNKAAEEMTGVRATDILGKNNYEYAMAFYGERRPTLLDLVLKPDTVKESDYPALQKRGDLVISKDFFPGIGENGAYLYLSAAPLCDPEGRVIGAVESVRDATNRTRTEEELLRIKKAVETASNAIWMTDNKGIKVVYYNDSFAKLFKYTGEELNAIGGCPVLYLDTETSRRVFNTLRNGNSWSGELELKTNDGSILSIFLYGDVVRDETNAIMAYLGIATDITEKKRAEAELIESQQRMASIIDFLPDSTFAIDLEGKVIAWNKAMEEMSGVKAKDILGKGDYEYALFFYGKRRPILIDLVFLPDENIEKDYKFLEKENGILIAETPVPVVKGKPVVLWGKATLLYDTQGSVVGAIETIRDVTGRYQAEESLKKSYEELRLTLAGTVTALSTTAEKKDLYTAGHQQRVASLACAIGREMGLNDEDIDTIRIAGIIHDIGKIYLPAEILSKPGKISELERAMIMTHSTVGFEIVSTIPFKQPIAKIVLQHHERVNGSGYPAGLTESEILLEAQIISVADVVEAMAMHRPYRPALGVDVALQEITDNRGLLYNSSVVDACLAVFNKGFAFPNL